MVLTIILLIALLYAVWKWWCYFCGSVYLAKHLSKNGVPFPTDEEVRAYTSKTKKSIFKKFLNS